MANKNFGIKQLNLVGESGTPTIESPDNLNLTANIVAISTDMIIGGQIQSDLRIGSLYSVGIGTTNPTSKLTVSGNVKVVGVVTATSFFGDGSTLTGVVGSGSGVIIQGNGTPVGTAGTINFASNLNVTFASGIATITATGGGSSQFVTTSAGIHTLSNVGIGTTNPKSKLTVSGDALVNSLTVGRGGGNLSDNTAIGVSCLAASTTGNYNTGVGYRSLFANTTGSFNSASGETSLYNNISGEDNTANGFASLGFNINGNLNTAHGVTALFKNTSGNNNTGIGVSSGFEITTGSKNTILGSYDGNKNGLDIRTSNNNVVLSDGDGNIRFYANSSGNVGLGTTNPISKLTVSGDINVTGVVTATSLTGSGSGLTNIPSGQLTGSLPAINGSALTNLPASSITFTITAPGSSDYEFSGPGIVSGNTLDPVLYLYKGFTYTFINTTGASHPFAIRVSNQGSNYTSGVSGSNTGTQTFVVPMNAPSTLYYQCTIHSNMGNVINII